MKFSNIITGTLLSAAMALGVAACSDGITVGNVEAPEIPDHEAALLYVTDAEGSTAHPSLEVRDSASIDLYVNTAVPTATDEDLRLTYDAAGLNAYNRANGTNFEMYPQHLVSFSNNGHVTMTEGANKSEAVTVTIVSDGSVDASKTYVLPINVRTYGESDLAKVSETRLIFVRDLTALPNCYKVVTNNGEQAEGVKIFSVMEVNDTNPLNNLRFTLKNSGKYMVDALVMFSGNINYNAETGKVYFYANPNVQHLLDNKDKYLRPLKDRGMKVIMGVMCNHDRACISNLATETAKLFAKELDALCKAYDLDGIFWDDEYCSPISPAPPGFVNRSNAAFSRLAYEFWKLDTSRWNVAYGYSMTGNAQEVDGVQAGTYITYVLPDYGYGISDWSNNFPGMPRNHMGACSMEFAQGRTKSESQCLSMRNQGYGACMVFAMDPYRSTASTQEYAMTYMARAFYDDEIVIDPTKYAKDW